MKNKERLTALMLMLEVRYRGCQIFDVTGHPIGFDPFKINEAYHIESSKTFMHHIQYEMANYSTDEIKEEIQSWKEMFIERGLKDEVKKCISISYKL